MRRLIDIAGRRFGMLTVLRFDRCEGKRSYWTCRCDCGKIVVLRKDHFAYPYSKAKSCGCYHRSESSRRMSERHRRRRGESGNVYGQVEAR